jgi:hypothetical protein
VLDGWPVVSPTASPARRVLGVASVAGVERKGRAEEISILERARLLAERVSRPPPRRSSGSTDDDSSSSSCCDKLRGGVGWRHERRRVVTPGEGLALGKRPTRKDGAGWRGGLGREGGGGRGEGMTSQAETSRAETSRADKVLARWTQGLR